MKIICQKNELLKKISIASKAVSPKSTNKLLECLVISAKDNIKITANNNEMLIETICEGVIHESGSIAIESRIFIELIRKLEDADVVLDSDADFKLSIDCEEYSSNLVGFDPAEFQFMPDVERSNPITISQSALRDVITQTIFSASKDEKEKITTGELFEVHENTLKVTALDRQRVAVRQVTLSKTFPDLKVIVLARTLGELTKILSDNVEDYTDIFIGKQHILFEMGDTILLSRLIDGEFFNVDQMLGSKYNTKLIVNRRQFIAALDRSTTFIGGLERKPVVFNVKNNKINISVHATNGGGDDFIDAEQEGDDLEIGFNPVYFLEALKVIEDEDISLTFTINRAPCFIRDASDSYIYMILPMTISSY